MPQTQNKDISDNKINTLAENSYRYWYSRKGYPRRSFWLAMRSGLRRLLPPTFRNTITHWAGMGFTKRRAVGSAFGATSGNRSEHRGIDRADIASYYLPDAGSVGRSLSGLCSPPGSLSYLWLLRPTWQRALLQGHRNTRGKRRLGWSSVGQSRCHRPPS